MFDAAVADDPVDPYLFPARGRKLSLMQIPVGGAGDVDPYLFPARGRKL